MRASAIRLAKHVHNVLMKFPDRKQPRAPHTPHPHPSAPREIKEAFDEFIKKSSSVTAQGVEPFGTASGKRETGNMTEHPNFWEESVSRYWNPIPIEEWEIEVVESGGATISPKK